VGGAKKDLSTSVDENPFSIRTGNNAKWT